MQRIFVISAVLQMALGSAAACAAADGKTLNTAVIAGAMDGRLNATPLATSEATMLRLGGDWQPRTISLTPAKWIWLPSQRTLPNTFVLFRKEIELAAAPRSAFGWIAADSRYLLTVNGQRVQWGLAPCDPRNLDADPIDLKPFLKAGKNVIGIEVLFFGHGDGTWPGGKPGIDFNLDVETPGGKLTGGDRQEMVGVARSAHIGRDSPSGGFPRCRRNSMRGLPAGWDTVGFQPDATLDGGERVELPAGQGRRARPAVGRRIVWIRRRRKCRRCA